MIEKYIIEGMSCTACSASIERVTRRLDGVKSSNVNLISKILYIEYDESKVTSLDIINTIKKAGFNPSLIEESKRTKGINYNTFNLADNTSSLSLKNRLISSLILNIILMYFSMGYMLNLYIPFRNEEPIIYVIIEALLALAVIIINRKFYINGFKALIHKAPSMDTLVSLGSAFSYIYGIINLILLIINPINKDEYLSNLYFDSSSMILFLITIGKTLENKAKNKTNSLVESLKELAPKSCIVLKDNKETSLNIEDIKIDDLIIVKEGEMIPLDGIITKGESLIDESSLTGESLPVHKRIDDKVYQSTINTNGYLIIRVTETSESSTVSKMIDAVNKAGSTKANLERLADKVSYYFVPTIILISLLTFIGYIIFAKDYSLAINHSIQVLVISCPCALGLATPLSITASIGLCAKKGILVKEATAFEILNKAQVFVFDKTGTITKGVPEIKEIITYGIEENDAITILKSMEAKSSHPLSKSIKDYRLDLSIKEVYSYESIPGLGLKGIIDNENILVGSDKLLKENNIIVNDSKIDGTLIYIAVNNKHVSTISLIDTIRDEAKDIVGYLKNKGYEVALLSGDNYNTTIKIRDEALIDIAYDSLTPLDKERIIREVKENKNVIYIGDGINDSIALKVSSLGISISGAKGIALDASSVILLKGNLEDIPSLIEISKRTVKIIKENLFWAFFYNLLMIPISIGAFNFIGLELSPMLCALSMSLSSLIVVTNSLRLKKEDKRNENRS